MSARQTFQWPPAARERIRELWLAGSMSASQMAAICEAEHGFTVTKSAVIGVAYRLGLAFQGRKAIATPEDLAARRDRQAEARRAAKERRERLAAAKPPKLPAAKGARAVKRPRRPVPAIPAALPSSLRIPLVEAREGQCRFIADDPRAGPVTCCGHPAVSGSAWCEPHRALCTSRAGAVSTAWIPRHIFRRAA